MTEYDLERIMHVLTVYIEDSGNQANDMDERYGSDCGAAVALRETIQSDGELLLRIEAEYNNLP